MVCPFKKRPIDNAVCPFEKCPMIMPLRKAPYRSDHAVCRFEKCPIDHAYLVLSRRFEDGLANICVLFHSCRLHKESETTGLNDGRKWRLVGNATDVGISDKVVPTGAAMKQNTNGYSTSCDNSQWPSAQKTQLQLLLFCCHGDRPFSNQPSHQFQSPRILHRWTLK